MMQNRYLILTDGICKTVIKNLINNKNNALISEKIKTYIIIICSNVTHYITQNFFNTLNHLKYLQNQQNNHNFNVMAITLILKISA